MLDKPFINASFETLATFWPPASPDETSPGMLIAKKGRLHFDTAPKYERMSEERVRESMLGFGKALGASGRIERIECLTGRTREGNCTLFWLFPLSNPGVVDFRTSERIDSNRFKVGAAVAGLQLTGSDYREIESAAFCFTGIHEWLPRPWSTEWTQEHITHRIPLEATEVFCFSNLSLSAEVTCEVRTDGNSTAKGRTLISPLPIIRIKPKEPQSFEWFFKLIPRVENFFSLLLGTSVAPKQIALFKGGDAGYLVQRRPRKKEKPNPQLWVKCSRHVVAGALANWLSVPDEEQVIEKVVLGNIRKSDLFVETEFLGLAQGLEAFGRIHFKDGRQTYDMRLRSIWNMVDPEFAKKIFGEPEPFIRSIVQTRNFFTHLGSPSRDSVIQESYDLFLLNQQMHALLRCAMLRSLGIPAECLRDAIQYQATRWR